MGIVDLDLLFQIPQRDARIIGGKGEEASFKRFNNGGERELKEWLNLPPQGGRKAIYSPREKTSRLRDSASHSGDKFGGAETHAEALRRTYRRCRSTCRTCHQHTRLGRNRPAVKPALPIPPPERFGEETGFAGFTAEHFGELSGLSRNRARHMRSVKTGSFGGRRFHFGG